MLDPSAGAVTLPRAAAAGPAAEALLPLRTEGLTLEIDGKRLVDGIDLTLAAGSFTAVMGPNGAGKSLLLRLLHGLLEPTSGAIRWGGAPLGEAVRRRQAMVFQQPVLLRRSVAANVDYVLRLKGPVARDRRDGILDHVGLLDRAKQPARLLSGGEQQRLALARALAVEPEVLFLDEPTASLDPASVLMIEEIVCGAQARGTKIIFVTHDLGQARRLADEVVFLHRGRLAEQASADRFFTSPACEAARAYLEGRIVL
ncbi:MAG: ATP-binding cassette domain-containing protein [Kiloniellales bacterium]|nr:ATP-binding cassette domain-containing protein [Kiloniellales bacterium]